MLRDHLIAALKHDFAHVPFVYGTAPKPMATVTSPCAEVGDLYIYEHGEEATVGLSEITHGHFDCYGKTLSDEERASGITEQVIDFLRALFADRVLLYRTPNRGMGGWRRLDLSPESRERDTRCEYFLWSGPAPIDGGS